MFLIRDYPSTETYDVGKIMDFTTDCYDIVNSPVLNLLNTLPVVEYYDVVGVSGQLDVISQEKYNNPYMVPYIMYFNGLQNTFVDEGAVLKLFDINDFNSLYQQVFLGNI